MIWGTAKSHSVQSVVAAAWTQFVFVPSHTHVIWGHCHGARSIHYASFLLVFCCQNFLCFYIWGTNFICNLLIFSESWHLPATSPFKLFHRSQKLKVSKCEAYLPAALPAFEAVVPIKHKFLRAVSPNILQDLLHLCSSLSHLAHELVVGSVLTETLCWTGQTHLHSGSSSTQVTALLPCMCTKATSSSATSQPD